jgi:hypothetical protein
MALAGCHKEETTTFDDLVAYKNSYVGDNSAVGGILDKLPAGGAIDHFQLLTSEEPYGIIVFYKTDSEHWQEEMRQNLMMYNSAALFALIDNVEEVTFILEGDASEELKFLRSEIEVLITNPWSYYCESADNWEKGLYKQLYLETNE